MMMTFKDQRRALTAEIEALAKELGPYFGAKRGLEDELRKLSFTYDARIDDCVRFTGTSPCACKDRFEKYGEILEPGHFTTIKRRVLQRDQWGKTERKRIFAMLLKLAEQYGARHNRLRALKADRDALDRYFEAMRASAQRSTPTLFDR